ncbi:MAG: hypothetical protein BWY89_02013 [Bacteroidetes bacterium ADurb.BinA012]|nr:MAG: hypothetical protein BWY89_02013 [Bacteroidetes bacterium ADurb.BinA012]
MLQELRLEPGHIHSRRALAAASLAGKAQVEDLIHLMTVPGVWSFRIKHLPHYICPGTGCKSLITGGHKAWAHHAAYGAALAAVTRPVAFFGCTHHTSAVREIVMRCRFRCGLSRSIAQRAVHGRGVRYLAGIEYAVRVKNPLYALVELIVVLPDYNGDELSPQPSVTVFAAHRATVFFHYAGSLFSYGA